MIMPLELMLQVSGAGKNLPACEMNKAVHVAVW
jgi:hypothetical protein